MKISVIIPVYNQEKLIIACLDSLVNQSLKPHQIIIIDDGSTDKTLKLITKYVHDHSAIKVIKQSHLGAATARNFGAKHASGEILVFVDSDMEFDKNFINKLTEPIRNKKTRGTFSKDEIVKNWDNPWARAWSYCLGLKSNRLIPKNHPNTGPVFRSILKSEFIKVKGFDQNRGYDDDWSLSQKLGYKAKVVPGAIYYHHNPQSLKNIFYQARWRASRKYKLGLIGKAFVFVKIIFLSVFLISPIFLSLRFKSPHLFLVKIVYDAGILMGLIKYQGKK